MKKQYKQLLPFNINKRVDEQFGILPLSIIEPDKLSKKKWNIAYLDDGQNESKRSEDAKYLANYSFSEFHAGLAEFIIKYWSLPGATIVDPFSGRITRAVVSSKLNRQYFGYEISKKTYNRCEEHIQKNNIKNITIYNEDGCQLNKTKDNISDLIMTCPPYHNIEKYESCENQLSDIKTYEEFLQKINICAINMQRVMKPGSFLVWVCGDWRDKGTYRSFHSDCINLFIKNNLIHWDTIIMRNMSPFAALQAGKIASKRYTSKIHEFILVFRKEGELDYFYYDKSKEIKGKINKFFKEK